MLPEAIVAVCSPSLLAISGTPIDLDSLRHHTLLHDDSPDADASCPNWEMWLRAAGKSDIDSSRGPRFNQSSLVLEAAARGGGIALAKSALAAEDLASGRLVSLFMGSTPVEFAYYIVSTKAKLNLPKVSQFRDWLKAEVARDTTGDVGVPST